MKQFVFALACLLIAACGGGEIDDGTLTTVPADCEAHPELCK